MNSGYVSIPQSLYRLALAVLCGATVITSVAFGESKAVTTATEELRKIPNLELWVSADDLSGGEGATVTKWPDRTAHVGTSRQPGESTRWPCGRSTVEAGRVVRWQAERQKFRPIRRDAQRIRSSSTRAGRGRSPSSWCAAGHRPRPEFHQTAIWTAAAPAARDKIAGLHAQQPRAPLDERALRQGCLALPVWRPAGREHLRPELLRNLVRCGSTAWSLTISPSPGTPSSAARSASATTSLYHNGFAQFGGYIAEVLIYKRGLSKAECQAVSHYLRLKYGLTGRQIVLEGHSQFNTLVPQLERRLPGWSVNNAAIGGTAMHVWVAGPEVRRARSAGSREHHHRRRRRQHHRQQ